MIEEIRRINTQLPDFEIPEIHTYSLESTIAEKFDGLKLQTAIFETLQNRGTPYDKNSFQRVVELADDMDMQVKWRYFLKNIKNDALEFNVVITGIRFFLEPVFEAIVSEMEWQGFWRSSSDAWLS